MKYVAISFMLAGIVALFGCKCPCCNDKISRCPVAVEPAQPQQQQETMPQKSEKKAAPAKPDERPSPEKQVSLPGCPADKEIITGKVKYTQLEGGFYELISKDGRHFDPINLPEDFKKDGLPVKFCVKPRKDLVGFHMRGTIVEILDIQKAGDCK
jgi:hypothetical protein